MKETVFIGADHAGFKLKEQLMESLTEKGFFVEDLGAFKLDKSDDYPDFAVKVAQATVASKGMGILVCGSSQGMCIAANKIKGARAVAVSSEKEAKLTREHNDANILCLSGWQLPRDKAVRITNTWLKTKFSSSKRHVRRLNKIKRLE